MGAGQAVGVFRFWTTSDRCRSRESVLLQTSEEDGAYDAQAEGGAGENTVAVSQCGGDHVIIAARKYARAGWPSGAGAQGAGVEGAGGASGVPVESISQERAK